MNARRKGGAEGEGKSTRKAPFFIKAFRCLNKNRRLRGRVKTEEKREGKNFLPGVSLKGKNIGKEDRSSGRRMSKEGCDFQSICWGVDVLSRCCELEVLRKSRGGFQLSSFFHLKLGGATKKNGGGMGGTERLSGGAVV